MSKLQLDEEQNVVVESIGAILSRPPPEEYFNPFRDVDEDRELTKQEVARDIERVFPLFHSNLLDKKKQIYNKAVEIMDGRQLAMLADTHCLLQWIEYDHSGMYSSPRIRDNLVALLGSLDATLGRAKDEDTIKSVKCLVHFLSSAIHMCAYSGLSTEMLSQPTHAAKLHEKNWQQNR